MINIAILGYGNLGRGVENSIKQNQDMNLMAGIKSRNALINGILLPTNQLLILPCMQNG